MNTAIIAGKGPSAYLFDWHACPYDIIAVSGGLHECGPTAKHFVSVDRPMYFPIGLMQTPDLTKHVPINKWFKEWQPLPNVRYFPYSDGLDPEFKDGPVRAGLPHRNHSLLSAVQIAPRLGYDRLIFVGVDLLENELWPIGDKLKEWSRKDTRAEWLNASELSYLKAWMPFIEMEQMQDVDSVHHET